LRANCAAVCQLNVTLRTAVQAQLTHESISRKNLVGYVSQKSKRPGSNENAIQGYTKFKNWIAHTFTVYDDVHLTIRH